MTKRQLIVMLLLWTLAVAYPMNAQDDVPTPDIIATQNALLDDIRREADRVDKASESVDQGISRAFDLLGLFEAIGFLVTIVAGGIGIFGVTRLFSAQNQLTQAREKVERELDELGERFQKQLKEKEEELDQFRVQFEAQLRQKEAELDNFRQQLSTVFDQRDSEQRERTARALLAQSLLPLGERQYKVGDREGALSTYHRALELDPNNPITHYRLGYVYVQKNDLHNAEKFFSSAMQMEKDFAPAIVGLGFVYRRMAEKMEEGIERDKRMNQAESLMLQALSISPRLIDEDGESWWGALGGLYRRNNQVDKAIKAYERAIEVTPHSSYGWGNLALLYTQTKNREKMQPTYVRVERLAWAEAQTQANNYWGYSDTLTARLALGKIEEAEEVLDTTLELATEQYQLDMLIDTLTRLQEAVEVEKEPAIAKTIRRIKEYSAKRFANSTENGASTHSDSSDGA